MIHRFTQTAVIEVKQQCAGQHFVGAPEMLHPTVERGNKAVVGAGCLVAQATSIGDRTSVKRSVVGASCKCVLSQCQGAPCSGEFPLLHGCTPVRATVCRFSRAFVCRIGANVKILNSLIMDEVVIGDNAHIQNSIIGHKAVIGSKAQLKDCSVGHEKHVRENADHRDEQLASSTAED